MNAPPRITGAGGTSEGRRIRIPAVTQGVNARASGLKRVLTGACHSIPRGFLCGFARSSLLMTTRLANKGRKVACQYYGTMLLLAALAACAPSRPIMSIMSEQEVRECEAQGGSVEPAYALHHCVFSEPEAPPSPNATTERAEGQAQFSRSTDFPRRSGQRSAVARARVGRSGPRHGSGFVCATRMPRRVSSRGEERYAAGEALND